MSETRDSRFNAGLAAGSGGALARCARQSTAALPLL